MKVAIFSTQTSHHTWYIKEMAKFCPKILCVLEERTVKPTFSTHHDFENDREIYERQVLLENNSSVIADFAQTIFVKDINEVEKVSEFQQYSPDLVIVFGTGKINPPLIDNYQGRIINLHGGDPESYRGLDSHLWAIYHGDYQALVTTLHHLTENLDDGEVIAKKQLDLSAVSHIRELRAINTRACVELSVTAVKMYETFGELLSSKQRTKGRYYSFMPTDLKEKCYNKFNNYIQSNAL
jgi:folate-dependent phosphoribosylglycinamide formyltransferase PurN